MTHAVTYTVTITHADDGDLTVQVREAGDSERDRASIAWCLREAARMVEDGMPVNQEMFS